MHQCASPQFVIRGLFGRWIRCQRSLPAVDADFDRHIRVSHDSIRQKHVSRDCRSLLDRIGCAHLPFSLQLPSRWRWTAGVWLFLSSVIRNGARWIGSLCRIQCGVLVELHHRSCVVRSRCCPRSRGREEESYKAGKVLCSPSPVERTRDSARGVRSNAALCSLSSPSCCASSHLSRVWLDTASLRGR